MTPNWKILKPDPKQVNDLAQALKWPPMVAALLVNRHLTTPQECKHFLGASFDQLTSPSKLKDINKATHRIARALLNRESILVFGDYDVDGVTSTTLFWSFLKACGAAVRVYIPHRRDEGYGLKSEQIESEALAKDVTLIITVDCGVSSHAAIALAGAKGIDVIVTDHHEVPDPPPPSLALINPKQKECPAGLAHLAGVGVAFYLILNVRKHLRETGFWNQHRPEPNLKQMCDLVALGTVADMVPLVRENRILVHAGLKILQNSPRVGLKALMSLAGVYPEAVDGQALAFQLAPRINAAGRMAHARSAFRLMASRDKHQASKIADDLEQLNQKRRNTENKIVKEVQRSIKKTPALLEEPVLVLWEKHWHEGVLGIAASRASRQYHRPVILISVHNGIAKGSARSIPGIDIHMLISLCKETLLSFGGHALAAGLQLAPEMLLPFKKRLLTIARKKLTDMSPPELLIDGRLDLHQITPALLNRIAMLAPFGTANPEPLFYCDNVIVTESRVIGKTHLKLKLHQKEAAPGATHQAIWFNPPTLNIPNHFNQLAFKASWNHWNGTKKRQIEIVAVQ